MQQIWYKRDLLWKVGGEGEKGVERKGSTRERQNKTESKSKNSKWERKQVGLFYQAYTWGPPGGIRLLENLEEGYWDNSPSLFV